MKLKFILVLLVSLIIRTGNVLAQDDNTKTAVAKDDPAAVALTKNLSEEEAYVWPKDPKVMENLKKMAGLQIRFVNPHGIVLRTWYCRIVGIVPRRLDYTPRVRRLLPILQ
jgi:hypothetical protein